MYYVLIIFLIHVIFPEKKKSLNIKVEELDNK